MIDRFDSDRCPRLRHGEYVDYLHGVLVDEFAQHQPHDFHWYASTTVFKHLEKRSIRDSYHGRARLP